MEKHIENLSSFGVPVVVAVNRFPTDTEAELELIKPGVTNWVRLYPSPKYGKRVEGGIDLAEKVVEACTKSNGFRFLYDENSSPREKIETISKGSTVQALSSTAMRLKKTLRTYRKWVLTTCWYAWPRPRLPYQMTPRG